MPSMQAYKRISASMRSVSVRVQMMRLHKASDSSSGLLKCQWTSRFRPTQCAAIIGSYWSFFLREIWIRLGDLLSQLLSQTASLSLCLSLSLFLPPSLTPSVSLPLDRHNGIFEGLQARRTWSRRDIIRTGWRRTASCVEGSLRVEHSR